MIDQEEEGDETSEKRTGPSASLWGASSGMDWHGKKREE